MHAFSLHLLRQRPAGLMVAASGTAAGLGLFAAVGGFGDDGPILCPVRNLSGGYCPGCGLSRACGALVQGQFVEAVTLHPYLPILLIQLLGLIVVQLVGPASAGLRIWNALVPLTLANGTILLGIWLVRLTTGTIPVPFSG